MNKNRINKNIYSRITTIWPPPPQYCDLDSKQMSHLTRSMLTMWEARVDVVPNGVRMNSKLGEPDTLWTAFSHLTLWRSITYNISNHCYNRLSSWRLLDCKVAVMESWGNSRCLNQMISIWKMTYDSEAPASSVFLPVTVACLWLCLTGLRAYN